MPEIPLDRIHIRDLSTRCIIGINPEERVEAQEVIINLTLHADLREAARSDKIEDTLNYKTLKKEILAAVNGSSYFLLERLAGHIAEIALRSGRATRVDVCIDKPGALRYARSVAVELTREKSP